MHHNISVLVPPTTQVVLPEYVRQNYARASNAADDGLISHFVDVSTTLAEKYLNRVLLTQTIQLTLSRKTIPHAFGGGLPWVGFGSPVFNDFWSGGCRHIDLPCNPIQQVLGVQRGQWSNPVDTLLVEGIDYNVDLLSAPARIRFINTASPGWAEHVSIQFTAGYASTNLLNVTGTATGADTISATVGGVAVSAAVNDGDTAPTVLANLWTAIQAATGTPAASLYFPSTIQLRGADVSLTNLAAPAGLTITGGTPANGIPAPIKNAVAMLAAHMYQNLAAPSEAAPAWFIRDLSPFQMVEFG